MDEADAPPGIGSAARRAARRERDVVRLPSLRRQRALALLPLAILLVGEGALFLLERLGSGGGSGAFAHVLVLSAAAVLGPRVALTGGSFGLALGRGGDRTIDLPGTPVRSAPRVALAAFVLVLWSTMLPDAGHTATMLGVGYALLFCVCAAAYVGTFAVESLRVARALPRRTVVGSPTPVTYTIENAGRASAGDFAVFQRPTRAGLRGSSATVIVPGVPAQGEVSADAALVFPRRGDAELRPVWLRSLSSLAAAPCVVELPAPASTLVRATEGRITPELFRRLRRGRASTGSKPAMQVGVDHFYGVREWRDGDDPRRIHWRTSAKRGVATLVEWRVEAGRRVVVVLGRGKRPGGTASAFFERSVSCAATLLRVLQRHRIGATLALGDDDDRDRARRTPSVRARFESDFDALARVEADGRRPERALAKALGERDRPLVVYVASGPEPEAEAALAATPRCDLRTLFLRTDGPEFTRWFRGIA